MATAVDLKPRWQAYRHRRANTDPTDHPEGPNYQRKDWDNLLSGPGGKKDGRLNDSKDRASSVSGWSNYTNNSQVDLYFVKKGSPVSPLYGKIPISREKKIPVHIAEGRSLLAEKGRTCVTKLSIPYRALIKSKIKSHWHRSKFISDTGSEITFSDSRSRLSEGSVPVSEPDFNSSFDQEVLNYEGTSDVKPEGFFRWLPSNLSLMKGAYPASVVDLSKMDSRRSSSSSPLPRRPTHLGARLSPPHMEEESPTFKKRRMNSETSNASLASPGDHNPMFGPHVFIDPSKVNMDDTTDSNVSTPSCSPSLNRSLSRDFKRKYKKDELWPAIESDYQFLMDEGIIETCKSTESDFSWDDDETNNTKVSFTEFMQQYKELSDWLNQLQLVTVQKSSSLCEKYLNQSYYEEMLQRSPRRKLFNDYAKQLMRRYPSLKEEITARLQHLNSQWEALEKAILPLQTEVDEDTLLKDMEEDLNGLRQWLHEVETKLKPANIDPKWSKAEISQKLADHEAVQTDIESHSKLVSSVLKLCNRLQTDQRACTTEEYKESLRLVATNLERRWHAIWLQSLEWECRLEEALTRDKTRIRAYPGDLCNEWDYPYCPSPEEPRDGVSFDSTSGITKDEVSKLIEEESHSDFDSDVIPFPECEYEKILVDTDVQTDSQDLGINQDLSSADSSGSGRDQGCESMDTEIDSALGRSVSDRSINAELIHSKLGHSHQETSMILKKEQKHKMEPHDIGYSSESHSNEEQDSSQKADGSVENVTKVEKSSESATQDTEKVKDKKAANQWRNSMTSAYDTSSNSSEPKNLLELEQAVTEGEEAPQPKGDYHHRLTSSPTHFYQVTTVEEDTCDDGHLDLDNLLSPVKDGFHDQVDAVGSPDIEGAEDSEKDAFTSKTRLDLLHNGLNYRLYPTDSRQGSVERSISVSPTECSRGYFGPPYSSTPSVAKDIPSEGEPDILDEMLEHYRSGELLSESLSVEADSNASHHDATFSSAEEGEPDVESAAVIASPNESIKRLIQQAELLIMDERLVGPPAKPKVKSSSQKKSRKRKVSQRKSKTKPEVVLSTDGSMAGSEAEESAASSCEAGSAYTTGTDSEAECACFGSDESESHDEEDGPTNTPAKIRRKNRSKRRDSGVKDLYTKSNQFDPSPLSISESAIDDIQRFQIAAENQNLRRTISDTSKHNDRLDKNRLRRKRKSYTSTDRSRVTLSCSPHLGGSTLTQMPTHYDSADDYNQTSGDEATQVPSLSDIRARRQLDLEETEKDHLVPDYSGNLTTDSKVSGATAKETDTDVLQMSMASTQESSEQAWDDYQAPPYTVSDAPTEERLDDSHLQWDPLDFEEAFQMDGPYGSEMPSKQLQDKSPRRKPVQEDDSDSDLEAFHHVIEESQRHLRVAESALKKHRKEPLDTGISLDPSKYAEVVATCQTNMKCLQEVCLTLESEECVDSMFETEMAEVQDTIDKWEWLHQLAMERQVQSRDLSIIYKDMTQLESSLQDTMQQLGQQNFENVHGLEGNIQALQTKRHELNEQRVKVVDLAERVDQYSKVNPQVKMSKFKSNVAAIRSSIDKMCEKSSTRISELQLLLLSWYDFKITLKELAYQLDKERQQLQCMEQTEEITSLSPEDAVEALHDLQGMKQAFANYEAKLGTLRKLGAELSVETTEQSAIGIIADVAMADNELGALKQRCSTLMSRIEHRAAYRSVGTEANFPHYQVPDKVALQISEATQALRRAAAGEAAPRSVMARILRAAIPLHIMLVLLLGLAYLLDPDSCDKLYTFGITLNPQLRYPNGPPPT